MRKIQAVKVWDIKDGMLVHERHRHKPPCMPIPARAKLGRPELEGGLEVVKVVRVVKISSAGAHGRARP